MSAENEAPVRRYVEEVYDQRKLEVVNEIFAPDFTLHEPDLPGVHTDQRGIKGIVTSFVDALPDLQISLDDDFSSGEKVVTRWTARGTHQGKISEAWLVFHAFGMMQQLGVASSTYRGRAADGRCKSLLPQRSESAHLAWASDRTRVRLRPRGTTPSRLEIVRYSPRSAASALSRRP